MRRISDWRLRRSVGPFFDRELTPLGAGGRAFFAPGPDPDAPTYYASRSRRTLRKQDFVILGCDSPEALAAALRALWQSQGCEELTPLIPSLVRLADALRRAQEQQTEEVSPFVYVMY